MFPVYFNALIKEDGSLTRNSDGSYSLVFTNIKNSVVLYQTWDDNTIHFNLKDFKVFSLDHNSLIKGMLQFNDNVNKNNAITDKEGFIYTPTVIVRVNNEVYHGKVNSFSHDESEEDELDKGFKITYNINFFRNTPPESYTGLVNMNMSNILHFIVRNANPDEKFLKWLDMNIIGLGSYHEITDNNLVGASLNIYLENSVTITEISANSYKIHLKNDNSVLFYQLWNKLNPLMNKHSIRTVKNTHQSSLYTLFKLNKKMINGLNIQDPEKFHFLPAASLRLIDGNNEEKSYLVQINDMEVNTDNEQVTYSLIVNTSKFDVYNSNSVFNLPSGDFKMTMDIDACTCHERYATGSDPAVHHNHHFSTEGDYDAAEAAGEAIGIEEIAEGLAGIL